MNCTTGALGGSCGGTEVASEEAMPAQNDNRIPTGIPTLQVCEVYYSQHLEFFYSQHLASVTKAWCRGLFLLIRVESRSKIDFLF